MKFTTMKQAAQFRITEKEDNYWIEDYWKAAISTWRSRLASVSSENYCQQNFTSKEMRQYVDYSEYVRSIKQEIDYAEGRIGE